MSMPQNDTPNPDPYTLPQSETQPAFEEPVVKRGRGRPKRDPNAPKVRKVRKSFANGNPEALSSGRATEIVAVLLEDAADKIGAGITVKAARLRKLAAILRGENVDV